MRRLLRRTGAVVVLLLVLVSTGRSAHAHGGGTPRLTAEPVGPYSLFAWTEPEPMRAGDVHVTLAVTTPPPADAVVNNDVVNNLLEQPIDGAEAVVTFRPADGGAPVQLAAQPGTLNAFYLEADTRLPAAGRWTIEVAVTGPDGAGTASFDVDVLPARGINRWLIFGGLGLFLALLVAIGLWARWPDAAADATTDAATSAPSPRRSAAHKSRR